MNKADELKARLRNHAKEVVDFSGGYNEQRTQVPKIKFIRLDMALSAIDELKGAELSHVIEMDGKHLERDYHIETDNLQEAYNAFDGKRLSRLVIKVDLKSKADCDTLIDLLKIHQYCFL